MRGAHEAMRQSVERGWAARTELLAGLADGHVVLVEDDADLVHQTDLLLIMAGEGLGGGVNVGEETEDGIGGDGLSRGGGGGGGCRGGRHGCRCGRSKWRVVVECGRANDFGFDSWVIQTAR